MDDPRFNYYNFGFTEKTHEFKDIQSDHSFYSGLVKKGTADRDGLGRQLRQGALYEG